MRSEIFQRILDNTPEDVDIFVNWYANMIIYINQLQSDDTDHHVEADDVLS